MHERPMISVVLPAYNAERYLDAALASVFDQTYPNLEVICVNDGSTDGTGDRLRSYGARITRIDLPQNGGIAHARNVGIRAARGAYLAFMDADDLWSADKLELQMRALDADPTLGMVFCTARPFISPELPDAVRAQRHCPDPMPGILSAAVLMRRATFDIVGELDTALVVGEFVDWLARARDTGVTSAVVAEASLHRRIHDTNTGVTRRDARPDYLVAVRRALERKRRAARE